jgi:P4 family phage/plasmid primase-like protien
MAEVKSILKDCKVEKGSAITHTSLTKPCGSFYIPQDVEEEKFLPKYAEAIENGADFFGLVERHRDVSPIIIDLDFKQDVPSRLYTDDMLEKFLGCLKGQITEYVEVDESSIQFFVLEKGIEARSDKGKGYKDGIHIVCPYVITKPEVQYIIRNNIIEKNMGTIFENVFKNTYDNIYDKSVIYDNGWLMYGSKKENEEYAWTVSKIYDHTINEVENTHSDAELISLLSIRNKFDDNKVKADKVDEVKAYKEAHKKKDDVVLDTPYVSVIPSSLENIEKLAMMLDPKRADEYKSWINWGMCFKSISEECLPIWIKFSRQSKVFVEGECEKLWGGLNPSTITEGTLRWTAKQDNPEAYKELQKKDIDTLIYSSKNETHTDIAKVVYALYKDQFKCCYINNKSYWYEFTNHHWEECSNAVSLKQKISNEVSKLYSSAAATYHTKASTTETDTEQTTYAEIGKKLGGIAVKLKMSPYKANIIAECSELFAVSQKDFYDKLDENKYLIGFNNGVYDLEQGVFRDGLPTDFLTYSCGVNYTTDIKEENRTLIRDFLHSIFEDQEMVQYMWNTTSYSICGDRYLEMLEFYTGDGANGKGTYSKLLKNSFGDYYYEPNVSVFTCKKTSSSAANPELAKTKGKRIVIASEPEETDKFQIGAIKNWTGGDLIQARELFKNNIEFNCQFKIAIQMNNKPKLSNLDGGIARRIRMVHFPFKFVDNPMLPNERKGDNSLKTRFETDKGIAQTFMMMLIENYNENIKGNKVFPIPAKIQEATQQYLDENNKVKKFLMEYVDITKDENDMVLSKVLFEDIYKMSEYYENERKDWFVEKMKLNGFESIKQRKRTMPYYDKQVYKGLKLKTNECRIESDDEL